MRTSLLNKDNGARSVIFNITTGNISGVLSVIKISGKNSILIINKFLKKKIINKTIQKQIIYRKLFSKDKKIIDDVILLIHPRNNSYDGNENVEIICHANKVIIKQIFTVLKIEGAQEAKPGEFSKNAFLNNKISLERLNAINFLIKTRNVNKKNFFINCITNKQTPNIKKVQIQLKDLITNIEASFNYPEEIDIINSNKEIKRKIKEQILFFENAQKIYQKNISNKEYLKIVIAGKTNSGKSTLFNQILGYSKNIISAEQQTTRDIVSEIVEYQSYNFELTDTAGFYNECRNDIDYQAITKTTEVIKKADLVIFLTTIKNNNSNLENESFKKVKKMNKNVIFIVNKADLIAQKDWNKNYISGRENKINNLMVLIKKMLKRDLKINKKTIILGSEYQYEVTNKIIKNFMKYLQGLSDNNYPDTQLNYLYENFNSINKLQGVNTDINIIDNIFSKFCIGK